MLSDLLPKHGSFKYQINTKNFYKKLNSVYLTLQLCVNDKTLSTSVEKNLSNYML